MPYINIHSHRVGYQEAVLTVVSLMAGGLAKTKFNNYFTLGIHPWQLQHTDPDMLKIMIQEDLALSRPIAIGEVGYDRSIQVQLEIQHDILVWQEEIAASLHLPVIYHAVKADDLLLARAKAMPGLVRIIHGFAGKSSSAAQLLRAGFCFSFGEALLNSRRSAAGSIRVVPLDRLFLETDESSFSIQEIYAQAANLLNLDVAYLRNAIFANFVRIFNFKE